MVIDTPQFNLEIDGILHERVAFNHDHYGNGCFHGSNEVTQDGDKIRGFLPSGLPPVWFVSASWYDNGLPRGIEGVFRNGAWINSGPTLTLKVWDRLT